MVAHTCRPRGCFVEKIALVLLSLAITAASADAVEVTLSPGMDFQAAVNANPTGTIFHIAAGLHRMQEVTPKDGDIFSGDAGAIMCGARLLTSFTRENNFWVATRTDTAGPGSR
jgi:hypothetical protein